MTPVAGAVKEKAEAAGLGGRLEMAVAALSSVVSELDPARLTGADATQVYESLVALERLCNAGKTLLAPRIDDSGVWRDAGHRSAAVMLALLEGVATGQAQNTLVNGQRLEQLPGTEAALRAGELSGPKVTQLTGAGVLAPEREAELLDGAEEAPLHEVRERCLRSRATSGTEDPRARMSRIRKGRSFSSWTDDDGAFCYQGRDTPDRGAHMLSRLNQVATNLRRSRRSAGEEDNDPERAVRADASFALFTGCHPDSGEPLGSPSRTVAGAGSSSGSGSGSGPKAQATGASTNGNADAHIESDIDCVAAVDAITDDRPPDGPSSLIDGPATCSVMVRVDLDALLRGRAEGDEVCEIDGHGPIPVAMARDLANNSFLRIAFHRAGDIRAVSHMGRTINQQLRTALAFRDRTCVVPGCGVSYGLEIDHIVPFAEGGPTTLDNLALLCHHHHFRKSYEGWILIKDGIGPEGRPRWRFEPLPPFGQEPGLGMDTDEARSRRARVEKNE